jgi:hypothetical protein
MILNLHIEQLTLRGFQLTPTDQAELEAALQSELTSLLATGGASQGWARLGSQALIQAQPVPYQPGTNPIHLGKQVAASLAAACGPASPASKE